MQREVKKFGRDNYVRMKGVRYGERDGKRITEIKRINEGGMEEEGMREWWKSDGGIDPV